MTGKDKQGVLRTLMSGKGYFNFSLKERLSLLKRILDYRPGMRKQDQDTADGGRGKDTKNNRLP